MNKHYEHIRKVCIAKNPSILDLVMGCEVRYYKSSETEWWYYVWTVVWHTRDIDIDDELKVMYNNNLFYVSDYEILGRPITLQDVLLALSEKLDNWDTINMHINTRWQLVFRDSEYPLLYDYDLSKPLSEQSDEVLEWLSKQLTK